MKEVQASCKPHIILTTLAYSHLPTVHVHYRVTDIFTLTKDFALNGTL